MEMGTQMAVHLPIASSRVGIPGKGSVRNWFVPQFSLNSCIFYGT